MHLDVAFSDVSRGEDFVRTGKSRSQVPSQEVSFDQKKNNPSSRPPVHFSSLSLEENQLADFFFFCYSYIVSYDADYQGALFFGQSSF